MGRAQVRPATLTFARCAETYAHWRSRLIKSTAEEARPATFRRCAGTHAHWRGRLMTYIQTKSALSSLVRARCARPNKKKVVSSLSQLMM